MRMESSHDQVCFSMDIAWSRDNISHLEHYRVDRLNCWRDLVPGSFLAQSLGAMDDEPVTREFAPGTLVPPYDPSLVLELPKARLNNTVDFDALAPGRFYPQGLISGIPGVFKGNMTPFKCIGKTEQGITADLNHALARVPLVLTLRDMVREPVAGERGGSCVDWMDMILSGPGMQAVSGTDIKAFSNKGYFRRADDSPDDLFYRRERLVHHIDARARKTLSQWYGNILPKGGRILDLMASWESHLPQGLACADIHGLGMNKKELSANKALTGMTVQDLNQSPALAFPDQSFDAVVCSLSVEYLTNPVRVFREAARVLKPGGVFALAFSNRWFPEKTIRVWPHLHEFERMGLVLDYFSAAGGFGNLATVSFRGYPRPMDDPYYPGQKFSDPVYGVRGTAH